MDFGTLLHVAKKNSENTRNEGKYYCTKYAPPKKESKEKKLSENIQKFLQKKEQEERERQRIAKEKRDQLIASRDEKSKNKIKKMLKVIKSANKSVLEDAVNNEHTALTMQGPDQPDEDDYGYTSQEASAFYQKYIEKVKDVKEEKYFAPSRPHTRTDLMGTKDRVKAALNRENDEKNERSTHHHSVTSSSSTHRSHSSLRPAYDPEAERLEEEKKKREEDQKKAKQRKPAPPPMDFQSLLKLAEKKQFEPILIPVEVKKEPTRLLTSKEKRELEERQKYLEEREKRRNGEAQQLSSTNHKTKSGGGGDERTNSVQRMEPNGRIPKTNQAGSGGNINKPTTSKSAAAASTTSAKITNKPQSSSAAKSGNDSTFKKPSNPVSSSSSLKSVNSVERTSQRPAPKPPLSKSATQSQTNESREKQFSHKSSSSSALVNGSSSKKPSCPPREFPPRDNSKNIQRKPTSGAADNQRRESMKNIQKTREFPPVNDRRNTGSNSQRPSKDRRKAQQQQLVPQKRRIYDDDEDDEEEYDSDLADFIDDGDAEEDYSSHIKAIFGYDRSRYRDMELDDAEMESSFAQQQREEYISKKIGLMEDLEDMKQEAIDKKRKAMMKKRKL